MGDVVSDGTEFSCPLCTTKLKIAVPSSSAMGTGKTLATTSNSLFPPPPGGQCLVCPSAPVPCAPSVNNIDPGQSAWQIDGAQALGSGCKFMCAKGGLLTVSSPGQSEAQHDGAEGGPSLGDEALSLAMDFTPVVGIIKSAVEVVSGKDLVTGEEISRLSAALGIIPGGKALSKGKKAAKVVKAASKGSKAKSAKVLKNKAIEKNPLEQTKYTGKVRKQMEPSLKTGRPDNHGFPKEVDNYASYGKQEIIKGGDGVERLKITLEGEYQGRQGTFEWIIEPDKSVNHRLFLPKK